MKKFLGFLLVLSLVLSAATTVSAETLVDNVELSGFDVVAGQPMPTEVTTGEYATVESVSWEKWNFTTASWEAVSGNFEDANAYRMTAILAPTEGYVFDTACFYSINGEESYDYAYTGGSDKLTVTHSFPLGLTVLSEVSLDETPDAKPGDNTADTIAKLQTPDGAPFRIIDANFLLVSDGSYSDFSGSFEQFMLYEMKITVAPEPGYWFDSYFRVHSDRAVLSNRGMDQATAWAHLKYDFHHPVEEVNISISGAEEGKQVSDLEITAPDDAAYDLTWEVYDSNDDLFTGTFAKDKYRIIINAEITDQYSFQDGFDVSVNGEAYNNFSNTDRQVTVEYQVDLRPVVEKVEVTITGMEPGKTIEDVKITVPEGAPYKVDQSLIFDEEFEIATGEIGKQGYGVTVRLICDEEYRFSKSKTVGTVNGEKPDRCDVSGSEWVLIQQEYFFGEFVQKVDTGIAKPKAGDPIPEPEWKTSKDGKIEYFVQWFKYEADGATDVTGAFENDSIYSLMVMVKAKEGVRFGDDLVVIAGGKELITAVNAGTQAITGAFIPIGDTKLVERIQPSAAQPTADKAPGTISGKGEGYEVLSGQWQVSDTENGERRAPGQTFKVGEYVFMSLKCRVAADYIADPALKVRLNGKDYMPLNMVEADEEGNFELVICLGKLKAAQNPNTGDETPLVLLTVLSMASVLGMGITLKHRKA